MCDHLNPIIWAQISLLAVWAGSHLLFARWHESGAEPNKDSPLTLAFGNGVYAAPV